MLAECTCGRDTYDNDVYTTCYQCFLERRAYYNDCIFCGRWHSPRFATCYACRAAHPEREEAAQHLRRMILARDHWTCRTCLVREGEPRKDSPDETVTMQVDHIKPCRVGGTPDPWNLQALCRECNQIKSDTWVLMGRYDQARIYNMHQYFTFLWRYLDPDEQHRLRVHANQYGTIFDFHVRRHGPGCDCPRCFPAPTVSSEPA